MCAHLIARRITQHCAATCEAGHTASGLNPEFVIPGDRSVAVLAGNSPVSTVRKFIALCDLGHKDSGSSMS
jgi:hypothetical protein